MRAFLFAMLVLVGGCDAIDDFNFKFDGSASADGGDGGTNLAAFGEACQANQCQQYGPQRPVSCLMTINGNGNNITFPDGLCSRVCTQGVGACTDYGLGVADC